MNRNILEIHTTLGGGIRNNENRRGRCTKCRTSATSLLKILNVYMMNNSFATTLKISKFSKHYTNSSTTMTLIWNYTLIMEVTLIKEVTVLSLTMAGEPPPSVSMYCLPTPSFCIVRVLATFLPPSNVFCIDTQSNQAYPPCTTAFDLLLRLQSLLSWSFVCARFMVIIVELRIYQKATLKTSLRYLT